MLSEELFKYIDLLQSCISRMAKDSFMVKGWAASFVVSVMVYLLKDGAPWFCIIFLAVPVVVFWKLDAFFLRTERCYRLMYEYLIGLKEKPENWKLYDLNPARYSNNLLRKDKNGNEKLVSEFDVMWSKTLWPFYLIPVLVLVVIGFGKLIQSAQIHEPDSLVSSSKSVEFNSVGDKFIYKLEHKTQAR